MSILISGIFAILFGLFVVFIIWATLNVIIGFISLSLSLPFHLFVKIGSLWTHVDCTDLNLLLGLSTVTVALVTICWAFSLLAGCFGRTN